jgi:hypothetical protein
VVGYVLVTVALVGYGRFETFGTLFTMHYHYWADLSIPLTLAVVLTIRSARPRVGLERLAPAVALCCLVAWVAGIVVSDVGFAKLWGKNPASEYFANLTADLEKAGPSVNLWDTQLPPGITTALSPDSRVSPVLRMAGIPFQLQGPGSDPLKVDTDGHVRPAELKVWTRWNAPPACGLAMHGVQTITLPLKPLLDEYPEANWFIKVGYAAPTEPRMEVDLLDAEGRVVALPAPQAKWPANLGTMYFGPSQLIRATSIRLRTTDPSASLCVGNVDVGLPEVTK